ncbi:glycerol-3-phosphate acyltransferase [Acutalibacter sp. 1XD8-33]|uniref:glycerol-3-phosphate acyltransferase n=1 Tax=Acutalibacter sp. 1XD8-33 TaxID=2320081 RepID=UPI000EA065A0|nr:glycerol-3-phosphate acyltransferase [Acutalibacter sp. 1XD8-33]RKJ39012.1 glycerol-3-phosphate acyltransferase [Acutalibacter sp. 1XD8-33]
MNTNMAIGIALLLCGAAGYLLGSINWAIILTKLYQRKDIRTEGSGNAGMTNVLRSVGNLPAILTFLGDFLKCVAAVLLSQLIMYWAVLLASDAAPTGELLDVAKFLAGVACVVGHIFPAYYGFRGGKGIVAAAAMIALTDWRVFLLVIATFGILFLWKKIISLASVTCAALYPVYTFLLVFFADFSRGFCTVGQLIFTTGIAAFIGGLVLFKHRSNIGRLLRGEEKPIIRAKEKK